MAEGWVPKSRRSILKTVPFEVEELQFDPNVGKTGLHPYYRLLCPDWVNVLPALADGRFILIRQPRAGVFQESLETPGGCVEADDADPSISAARELEEETGYRSANLVHLASIYANPAIQNNRIHYYLAVGCELPAKRQHFPDASEDVKIQIVEQTELESLLKNGKIDHSYAYLSVMLGLACLQRRRELPT